MSSKNFFNDTDIHLSPGVSHRKNYKLPPKNELEIEENQPKYELRVSDRFQNLANIPSKFEII